MKFDVKLSSSFNHRAKHSRNELSEFLRRLYLKNQTRYIPLYLFYFLFLNHITIKTTELHFIFLIRLRKKVLDMFHQESGELKQLEFLRAESYNDLPISFVNPALVYLGGAVIYGASSSCDSNVESPFHSSTGVSASPPGENQTIAPSTKSP